MKPHITRRDFLDSTAAGAVLVPLCFVLGSAVARANVSGFLAVTEMLFQSHEGVLRFFPAWPRDLPARFGTLRAVGAFLVLGECANGAVRSARIESEKGRPCRVQNPWPGHTVRILDATTGAEIPHSADPKRPDYLTFKTEKQHAYSLRGDGTPFPKPVLSVAAAGPDRG